MRPLGVDVDTFAPDRRARAFRRELGLPASTRLLAYAGRFSREKNLPVLLAAIAELGAPYHLVLAGPKPDVPLPANVTLLPFLHSSLELARILASVDGLVHAGDQETFGLVLLEAMIRCGTTAHEIAASVPHGWGLRGAFRLCACGDADVDHRRVRICTAAIAAVRGNCYVARSYSGRDNERMTSSARFRSKCPAVRHGACKNRP